MTDRKKVIKGLVYCIGHHLCFSCGYYDPNNVRCQKDLMRDALELLKEQKTVEPKLVGVNTWTCGECGALLGWEEFAQSGLELIKYKFCPECGRAVKWND